MTLALYGKSRRRQWMLVALALFALLGAMSAALAVLVPTNAASVTAQLTPNPDLYSGSEKAKWGNPTCSDLDDVFGGGQTWSQVSTGGWYDPSTATFPITLNVDPTHWVKITGIVAGNPMTFDWESNFGIDAVMVKQAGGPHNIYVYDPPGPESFGDTGLQPNLNPNGISHAIFCYDGFTTPTPPAATGNLIIGKVIDPSAGVATDDGTTFSGTIVNDNTSASTPWSGISFGQFTSPISMPSGVPLTVDEDSPPNGWTEVAWTAGSLDGTTPVCPADKASYVPGSNIGVNLLADQTQVLCVMNTKAAPTGPVVTVAKDHTGWNGSTEPFAEGDEFEWVVKVTVSNGPTTQTVVVKDAIDLSLYQLVTVSGGVGFPSCSASSGVVSCTLSAPKANGEYSFRIRVKILDIDLVCPEASNTAGLYLPDASTPFATASDTAQVEECTQVSPTGGLRIEKYLDLNGDGDANDLGEGPLVGWNMTVGGPEVNGIYPTADLDTNDLFAEAAVAFDGLASGDNYNVTEETRAGYVLTGVRIDGAPVALGASKTLTIPEGGTTVIQYFNQPRTGIKVSKTEISLATPGGAPGAGWSFTLSGCGIVPQTAATNAAGQAQFDNLPLAVGCTYTVTETQKAGWSAINPVQVANPLTPGGYATVNFTNVKIEVCVTGCVTIVETPTPTATPTNTPVPPTATPVPPTPEPTPIDETLGEKTPGPGQTPIAPSTGNGTGSGGGTANMNILLLVAGLAVLSGGLSLTGAGKRRRS